MNLGSHADYVHVTQRRVIALKLEYVHLGASPHHSNDTTALQIEYQKGIMNIND